MATYTVQDTTMTALGDAVRKAKKDPFNEIQEYTVHLLSDQQQYFVVDVPRFKIEVTNATLNENSGSWRNWATIYLNIENISIQKNSTFPIKSQYVLTPQRFYVSCGDGLSDATITFRVIPTDIDGNEISNKNKNYTPNEMINSINDLPVVPESMFLLNGIQTNKYSNNSMNWFFNLYGDKITTIDLYDCGQMFSGSDRLEELPFTLNFLKDTGIIVNQIFNNCQALKKVPTMNNLTINGSESMFQNCYSLNSFPEDFTCAFSDYQSGSKQFNCCYSLRKIPTILHKGLINTATSSYSSPYYQRYYYCFNLDDITELAVATVTYTSNMFRNTFYNCNRLNNLTFEMNEDGTSKTANWANQVIDMSSSIGYVANEYYILSFNSGITIDKKVYDDATYQALKDDPDWYSLDINYSRYNHDSAVNTINSLPDCSGSGGTNTITFTGNSGALTDGGAINTLTEEEIAVATAKGWTVSLV